MKSGTSRHHRQSKFRVNRRRLLHHISLYAKQLPCPNYLKLFQITYVDERLSGCLRMFYNTANHWLSIELFFYLVTYKHSNRSVVWSSSKPWLHVCMNVCCVMDWTTYCTVCINVRQYYSCIIAWHVQKKKIIIPSCHARSYKPTSLSGWDKCAE
jgi:hypothetical protein